MARTRIGWGAIGVIVGLVLSATEVVPSVFEITDRIGWTDSPAVAYVFDPSQPGYTSLAEGERSPGWGPGREMFTVQNPAPYVALNSIVDNPEHGDERNFVQVRRVNDPNEVYTDSLVASPGDRIVVYAWVSNAAGPNFSGSTGAVHGLSAKTTIQSLSRRDHSITVDLEGFNARRVWDSANILTHGDARLQYVSESATFHSAAPGDGFAVAELHEERAMLGFEGPDGYLPAGRTASGTMKGAGYLTFRVSVERSD